MSSGKSFSELERRLRPYETAYDFCVPAGNQLVVRLDGRGFTRLTKDVWQFQAPLDERCRDLMAATTARLMQCGFNVLYGYSQSDEISLLLHPDDDTFGRKTRKIISVLAAEASATFTHGLGSPATFDARVCILPTEALVLDYFRWRQEDAHRNTLNGHCYWLLRGQGLDVPTATARVAALKRSDKHELLFQSGTNFIDLPTWQKRGFGLYWRRDESARPQRQLHTDWEIPFAADYDAFLRRLLRQKILAS